MINAAIVGLGRWGQNLVNSIQGKSDKIRIVAGATRTVSKAADYAKQQGFPLHDSYKKVLADPQIDAIIVATPHTQRVEIISAAAQAGKHVFTEKPLALNKAGRRRIIKACAEAQSDTRGRLSTGAFNRRCRKSSACLPTGAWASCCISKAISAGRASIDSGPITGA